MSIAAYDTRDDKLKWFIKPFNIAFSLSWFGAIFGLTYFWFGLADTTYVVCALIAALGCNATLMLWGIARLGNAARG